ncbi:pantoate--beta-alanine ligase, partial [bacterium]|nr:pantoate--beta-alanine ligase [bacterium]
MIICKDIPELIRYRNKVQRTVGFVPTMGALHDGHISLIESARRDTDYVIVSIFVNPGQFGPNEDFDRYPRTIDADIQKLEAAGVDMVFLPSTNAVYPEGYRQATRVFVPDLSRRLCGKHRPGHFEGVTSVVIRLFNLIRPHKAFFGEKDFQQVTIIRKMSQDLALPIDIVGCPIVRDADGLAMSSRNRYLSPEERIVATSLIASLRAGVHLFK